jgi:hypothetical protein
MRKSDFLRLAAGIRANPRPFLERMAWVETKQLPGQEPRQKLVFNRAQRRVHDGILSARAEGAPPRLIVLKARQPGVSTLACGYSAAYAIAQPYAESLIVSHREDLSQKLHRKTKSIIDGFAPTLPVRYGTERRGEVFLESVRCDDGEVALKSSVICATAGVGAAEPGRGATRMFVHLSEYAQFPNPRPILVGALQSVPLTPVSLVMIESTAFGMGNSFHEEWLRAEGGDSGFKPVFIAWFDIDEYRLPTAHDSVIELSREEEDIRRQFGLELEQLYWRRYVIATQCAGDEDQFNQEYPATAAEAFIVSGLPAFPRVPLQRMYDAMKRLEERDKFEGEVSLDLQRPIRLRGGKLRLYRQPVPGHEYSLGADPSSGVEGGDPAAAAVFDRQTGEVVAVWQGHLAPIPFALVLDALGRFYNEAIIAPELNSGHGFSVVEELKMRQYPRLYVWQRVDKVTHAVTNFYGWSTSYRTRPLLIDGLRHAINEAAILVRDPPSILELLEFQYTDVGGRAEGIHHDDLAIAVMISYRVHLEYPMIATGLPPRAPSGLYDAQNRNLPQTTWPNAMTKEAWEGADEVLAAMARGAKAGSLRQLHDAVDDPEPTAIRRPEEPWEPFIAHDPDWEPDIPW